MSQNTDILKHLKKGRTINPIQALRLYGCFRLARVVHELKLGSHKIIKKMVKHNGKHYAQYRLA